MNVLNKIIVVSAVNLIEGGPLTILQKCLFALSNYSVKNEGIRVVAYVKDKSLCYFPNIEYVEIKWAKKSWLNRLYYEYIYSYFLSRRLKPYLWLSLHDITPNVVSSKRAVYCHNAAPFYNPSIKDFKYNYKEFLFSLFYKYLYQINIHKNDFVIVQQGWIKHEFIKMFGLNKDKIIIAKPLEERNDLFSNEKIKGDCDTIFFFPAYPRTFKNFEVICEACGILESQGEKSFKVVLTLDGTENVYSRDIYRKYHNISSIHFCGLLPKMKVSEMYKKTDCLIFPSKLETWGLPISEFLGTGRAMLIADLPYAHETAMGADKVCFFDSNNVIDLAAKMEQVIRGDYSQFSSVAKEIKDALTVDSWHALFDKLLED